MKKLFVLLFAVVLGLMACSTSPGGTGSLPTAAPGGEGGRDVTLPAGTSASPARPVPAEPASSAAPASGATARDEEAARQKAQAEAAARDTDTGRRTGPSDSPAAPLAVTGATGGSSAAAAERPVPQTSGLRAGFADDNYQFNYFLGFLDKYKQVPHVDVPIRDRITLKVRDSAGKPVPNALVQFFIGARKIAEGTTYADGSFRFYPSQHDRAISEFPLRVLYKGTEHKAVILRSGPREVIISLKQARVIPKPLPLDIVFVFDTTGSMSEEIQRLKAMIEIIHQNLSLVSIKPVVRFGMVLYKDAGDEEYRTRVVPLTDNLDAFRVELDKVTAAGGGDTPEDMQAALKDTIKSMQWNKDGLRLAFVITDAPAHLDYPDFDYGYDKAMRDAVAAGIKIYTVGTGGLTVDAEYVLRQISQYTAGRYIFLTYGEQGESEGGAPGSVSHHTGSNFITDKLETIIIRFAKEELQHLSDEPVRVPEDYFQAIRIPAESKSETLQKLFADAVRQLVNISTIAIEGSTPVAVVPILTQDGQKQALTEFFTEMLTLSCSREKPFKLLSRRDLQEVLKELELQLSGVMDPRKIAQAGKLLGAEVLLTGTYFKKTDGFEVFLKLVRVETGEILSIAKVIIAKELGL